MTPFFGRIEKESGALEQGSLFGMASAITEWGYLEAHLKTNGRCTFGQYQAINQKGTFWEGAPYETDDFLIVGTGRLDNRESLCNSLSVPFSNDVSNDQLLELGYQSWGDDLPEKLLGDWAFAIWDKGRKKLLLARDQLGLSQLLFFEDEYSFTFSTLMQPLLKTPGFRAHHNPMYISKALLGVLESGTATPFENVFRLLNGQKLVFQNDKRSIQTYWDFDQIKPIRFGSDQEYLDAFMNLYRQAVSDRLVNAQNPGMWLSSGLDSTSILSVIDELWSGEKIHSFTSIPKYDIGSSKVLGGRNGDESALVKMLEAQFSKLRANYVFEHQFSPMEAIQEAHKVLGHPTAAANLFWMFSTLSDARDMGVDRFFSGEAGNFTISYGGDPATKEFKLRWLRHGAFQNQYFVKDLKSLARVTLNRFFEGNIPARQIGLDPALNTKWFDQFYLKKDHLNDELFKELNARPYEVTRLGLIANAGGFESRAKVFVRQSLMSAAFHHQVGCLYGVESCDPTQDLRLVEYCFGIPNDQFARLSQRRRLIRKAMEDRLPREIVWNKSRGIQASDIAMRLKQEEEKIQAVIQKIRVSRLASIYIDTDRLWADFQSYSKLQSVDSIINLMYWYLTISVGQWLADLESGL